MKRRSDNIGYFRFFQEDLYPKFLEFLLNRVSASKLNELVDGKTIFSRGGVHFRLRRMFSLFLEANPRIHKIHRESGYKCMMIKNICGEPIHTPVDGADDLFMVKEGIRVPKFVPGRDREGRVWLATGYR